MAEEMTPEQIAEAQRKNCIFCKIIAGEIESKKVFENDRFLAVLDIRPAAPGHVLLLPKEHVPILPLLTEGRMDELFITTNQVADAVAQAMIAQKTTVFIASGYAAGQQAPHLIIHIIPREPRDGLDMLEVDQLTTPQPDALALGSIFTQATSQALKHKGRADLLETQHAHPEQPVIRTKVPTSTPGGQALVDAKGTAGDLHASTLPDSADDTRERTVIDPRHAPSMEDFETTNEALAAALNTNPDLRRLIIAQPDLVADYVRNSPRLSKLFEGVNIRALSLALQKQDAGPKTKLARDMSESELFTFIDGNQGLRTWIVENPDELIARMPENPRLQHFFQGVDVQALAKKYRGRGA